MTRIKICGLTRAEDARQAVECGAWALGFIFYSGSPRSVQPDRAKSILESLPKPHTFIAVGVFVNATSPEIQEVVRRVGLTGVQLHGDETLEQVKQIGEDLRREFGPEMKIFKAIRVTKQSDLERLERFSSHCDGVIFETGGTGRYGGAGEVGDWGLARAAAQRAPLILAGGLSPKNVAEAFRKVQPFAVDVSSGIERCPGEKSFGAMEFFFFKSRENV